MSLIFPDPYFCDRLPAKGNSGYVFSHLAGIVDTGRIINGARRVSPLEKFARPVLTHARLLRNAVEWAANEEKPVTVSGAGVLDVTIWRQNESMTVHLVNLTNPMMMQGPFREIFPVGPRKVKAHLLVAGETAQAQEAASHLTVTVPSIEVHEVIAVDLV